MRYFILMLLIANCLITSCQVKAVRNERSTYKKGAQGESQRKFNLTWAKAKSDVTKYYVRFGQDEKTLKETILTIDPAKDFDRENPSAVVGVAASRFARNKKACFALVAENGKGSSTSDPKCLDIP